MHNWPGLAEGSFAVREGPIMASLDRFAIELTGKGAHGALPHQGVDPVLAAAQLIVAVQSIVSRNVDPRAAAVVSITRVHAGDADNVIPERAELGGGFRCFDASVRAIVKSRLEELAHGVAAAFGARAAVKFGLAFPALVNTPRHTELAASAAAAVAGRERVATDFAPVLASEDFAFMLEKRPGCYVFIGNGEGLGGCSIHHPEYDFNDRILTLGATYWVRLAQAFCANPLA
jgi:amidohydrolase